MDMAEMESLTDLSEMGTPDKFGGYESEGSHESEDREVAELYPTEEAFTEACIHEDDLEIPEMEVIGRKRDTDDED